MRSAIYGYLGSPPLYQNQTAHPRRGSPGPSCTWEGGTIYLMVEGGIMMRSLLIILLIVSTGCASISLVQEGHHQPSTAATLGIPPGHLPPPGECRIWHPGHPPGHQPPPGPCVSLQRDVPVGAWLLYRTTRDRKQVRVSVYDERQSGVVVVVRIYEAATGKFLGKERP